MSLPATSHNVGQPRRDKRAERDIGFISVLFIFAENLGQALVLE